MIRMWPLARTGVRRVAPEVDDNVVHVRAHTADEVVPHAAVLLPRDLVGDEVEAVVHLDLVGVDDLSPEAQREVHRQLGLTCGHRAHHHHNLALARHSALHACTHTTVAVVKFSSHFNNLLGCVFDPTGNMQNASSLPSQFDLCANA
jgi:hypothetical protein